MNKLIVANLKMNLLSALERESYLKSFRKALARKNLLQTEIILCPPVVQLEGFQKALLKEIKLGAQNTFWEDRGSYTGEISNLMLKNFGCEYVILGHSERRMFVHEQDGDVNLKIIAALKNGLKPILCVGEDGNQKKEGAGVVEEQLENCLKDIKREKIKDVVICYEPVWAISSNNPDHLPTANEIMSAKLLVRKFIVGKYGVKAFEKMRIIYGGSVSAENFEEVCLRPGMDGVLVGKESLIPSDFMKIVDIIERN